MNPKKNPLNIPRENRPYHPAKSPGGYYAPRDLPRLPGYYDAVLIDGIEFRTKPTEEWIEGRNPKHANKLQSIDNEELLGWWPVFKPYEGERATVHEDERAKQQT